MDRPTDLHILSQSELFRGLSPDILDDARAAGLRRRLAKDEVLFRQEEEATTVYLVVAGRLRVTQTTASGQQIIIRYVGAGETAGYSAISGSGAYNSAAVAVDDSVLMGWRRERFKALMSRHGQIAVNALSVIESRYQEVQTRLRELTTETVERRIALTLLRLVRQAGRRTAVGLEVAFPISRQDVAEMAGTTLHTVSRTMSAWEGDGIVDSGRRRIVVRSPDALSAIAGVEPAHGGQP
jgi:CRP/FNR family transcriptional regulator, nitrogen oxide reductase regulator